MKIKVNYLGKTMYFDHKVSMKEVIGEDKNVIAVYANNLLREVSYVTNKNVTITPLTLKDPDGQHIYEASLRFILAMAIDTLEKEVNVKFMYGTSRSIFIKIIDSPYSLNTLCELLNNKLKEIVKNDYTFAREKFITDSSKYLEKKLPSYFLDILKYRPEKTFHIYTVNGYTNYMYSRLVPSTGYLDKYKLFVYGDDLVLQYPRSDCNGEIPAFIDSPMYKKILKRADEQAKVLGTDSVPGINKRITESDVDIISLSEAFHARQLTELGDLIYKRKDKLKFICIAGPSSSGKTTFANRLRIELLSRGLYPIKLSMDDYYKNREDQPLDEKGQRDFESIDAIDLVKFNEDIKSLALGKEVMLPKFNFETGHRENKGLFTLKKNELIIIEGIHALNERTTASISKEAKFNIFICPQAQININKYNPLSYTDIRLVRRIVRDNQFRSTSISETFALWPNVRKGEFKWIYSTQENADYVYDSFLYYELAAMRKHIYPLLNKIKPGDKYFTTAERIKRLLKFFVPIDETYIPCNSIIKEFIGGSCYKE